MTQVFCVLLSTGVKMWIYWICLKNDQLRKSERANIKMKWASEGFFSQTSTCIQSIWISAFTIEKDSAAQRRLTWSLIQWMSELAFTGVTSEMCSWNTYAKGAGTTGVTVRVMNSRMKVPSVKAAPSKTRADTHPVSPFTSKSFSSMLRLTRANS